MESHSMIRVSCDPMIRTYPGNMIQPARSSYYFSNVITEKEYDGHELQYDLERLAIGETGS